MPAPAPWYRRPDEPPQAYLAFRTYYELGPARTLPAAARTAAKTVAAMKKWSLQFDWERRALAYDHHGSEVRQREIDAVSVRGARDWLARREDQDETEYGLSRSLIRTLARQVAALEESEHPDPAEVKRALGALAQAQRCAASVLARHRGDAGLDRSTADPADYRPHEVAGPAPDGVDPAEDDRWKADMRARILELHSAGPPGGPTASSTTSPPAPPGRATSTG